ncbi:MAG: hypothetical protein AAF203_00600 [Pseudomonadota bacterium]
MRALLFILLSTAFVSAYGAAPSADEPCDLDGGQQIEQLSNLDHDDIDMDGDGKADKVSLTRCIESDGDYDDYMPELRLTTSSDGRTLVYEDVMMDPSEFVSGADISLEQRDFNIGKYPNFADSLYIGLYSAGDEVDGDGGSVTKRVTVSLREPGVKYDYDSIIKNGELVTTGYERSEQYETATGFREDVCDVDTRPHRQKGTAQSTLNDWSTGDTKKSKKVEVTFGLLNDQFDLEFGSPTYGMHVGGNMSLFGLGEIYPDDDLCADAYSKI